MSDRSGDKGSPLGWTKVSDAELVAILKAHKTFLARKPGGRRAMLAFYDLSNRDLSNFDLAEADMTGARLHRCRLNGIGLRAANLFGADLRMSSLVGADLTRAD
jgi:uncharacterized protein YjbI with pentapeptide repeats